MGMEDISGQQETSRQAEENYLEQTLAVVKDNLKNYGREVSRMQEDIDEMLAHYHDNDVEVLTILNNTVTMHDHMKRALIRNEKALNKPYFGRIIFHDEALDKRESIYIGRGGISKDTTHWMVTDWRAPVANAYYENGLGKCSYEAPGGTQIHIDLQLKRTYEIESGRLLDYFDSEVIANDDLLTKYLAKNKQAVLSEIVATIQKEQNEIIRKSPYHNIIVQGVAGSGKTTVAMHRISYILYNYEERFKPDDFYIVGSNRILLNYITGVLPDLDVYGIRQMTMEQLFVRLLYEDWDDKKYRIKSVDKDRPAESVKGSSRWFEDLEKYCHGLERSAISCRSVYLDPGKFVEGIKDGRQGVFDETTENPTDPKRLICLLEGEAVKRYIEQNPGVSVQSKINMLNKRLRGKIKEEFLGKEIKYTEAERKAILKAYRGHYGGRVWRRSIFEMYSDFLSCQNEKGYRIKIPDVEFDVYDLAALAYLYKRIKETEVISEAHHVVIDEAQDFGMMAYRVLQFCIYRCTYTIMGDVSQNIHFGYGLNDWEELKQLFLPDPMDSFGILKKSYRNTVEISDFATDILHHGQFSIYPVEPIIRHGNPVQVRHFADRKTMIRTAAEICRRWQTGEGEASGIHEQSSSGQSNDRKQNNETGSGERSGKNIGGSDGLDTIAVICRDRPSAAAAARELSEYVDVVGDDLEKTEFGSGIMVLPVEYTKGLEFDAVLILNPTREEYPVDDGHAKLLYVAATRALHELCVLHSGDLTGLIADPVPKNISNVHNQKAETEDIAEKDIGVAGSMEVSKTINKSHLTRTSNMTQMPDMTPKSDMTRASDVTRMSKLVPAKPRIPANVRSSGGSVSDQDRDRSKGSLEQRTGSSGDDGMKSGKGDDAKSAGGKERYSFGDMPATERLRPPGHGKIDLAVRWVTKQPDGLYLHSRYGILRLSPVGSAIVRVSFVKGSRMEERVHPDIAVHTTDKRWLYKVSGDAVELMTDELLLRVEKSTGSIRYMTRDKKLLLAERSRECRQLESGSDGKVKTWLYLDWQKKENIYGMGTDETAGISLRKTARYISHGNHAGELPFLLSDQGYGIVLATDSPVISCDLPTYGSYIHAESEEWMDFYFITGKRQNTILRAYAYLSGRL